MSGRRSFDIHGLPEIRTIGDLAAHAAIRPRQIHALLSSGGESYRTFRIAKPSGGFRDISHPTGFLRAIQKWILRHILDKLRTTPSCYGFSRGSSLRLHAAQHVGAGAVLSLDLRDFFPSISLARIRRVFRASGFDSFGAFLLARLCTFRGVLPQGAPSSPKLANLACFRMDRRLAGLAAKRDFVYTRYADDLSFSAKSAAVLAKAKATITHIIHDCGFRLNNKKTRLRGPSRARVITGLVLSDADVGVGRRRLRELRARIHQIHRSGNRAGVTSIQGWLDFISDVDPNRYRSLVRYIERLKREAPFGVINEVRVRGIH
jgi:RNA-directed DNA polymerase